MSNIEVCRLSAEACGFEWDTGTQFNWNPFTNAEQRWKCVEWLLRKGKIYMASNDVHQFYNHEPVFMLIFECPASEFPASAVAELQSRIHN